MPQLPHGPEVDARTQGKADAEGARPKRELGGELALFQRQYDISYDRALAAVGTKPES